jgi:hypothetical protein
MVQDKEKDMLFISTECFKFCVLEYDSASGACLGQLINKE